MHQQLGTTVLHPPIRSLSTPAQPELKDGRNGKDEECVKQTVVSVLSSGVPTTVPDTGVHDVSQGCEYGTGGHLQGPKADRFDTVIKVGLCESNVS